MKNNYFILGAFVVAALICASVYAEDVQSVDLQPASANTSYAGSGEVIQIPPGMEVVKQGDVNVVVPKGSQLRKINDLFLIESAEEYAARKFEVVERRLAQLEKDQAEMKKELERRQAGK